MGSLDASGRDMDQLESEAAALGIEAEQRPSRVSMRDHRAGVTIGLLNESHTDVASFYSEKRAMPTYKVIPDLDMGALLTQLEDFGFFAAATPSASRVPGARRTVQVERAGQVYTLAYTTESDAPRRELVQRCSMAVQAVYNYHQAYQVVENPEGEAYFERESRRLKQEKASKSGN